MNSDDKKVAEARDKALDKALQVLENSNNVNAQMAAVQAILNYDIQLRILDTAGVSTKQPTPWPEIGPVIK